MKRDLFAKCRPPQDYTLLQDAGIYPYFQAIEAAEGPEIILRGKRKMMAGSNNYLGLTHHPKVLEAASQALHKFGTGCTGSRFLNGTLEMHEELELRLARFLNKEAALVFSTGFQTCLGVITAIAKREDLILCDRENHASILDACRLSFADISKFPHSDMEALRHRLEKFEDRPSLIVVDGLFSMLGDLTPLPEIVALAQEFGSRVLVDDAHGFGVLGDRGAGTAEHFGLEDGADIIMGTFSKSMGGIGGYCAGPREVIEFIRHRARTMMFSASIPPAVCAAALAGLEVFEAEPERRHRVLALADRARAGLKELGFNTGPASLGPIVPVILGERERTFHAWKFLMDAGVFVNPITSPAVPAGLDLLRCSFMASHTDQHLDSFLASFAVLAERLQDALEQAPSSSN